MTELLANRTTSAVPTAHLTVMTCDVPVVTTRPDRPAVRRAPTCRPTGRDARARRNRAVPTDLRPSGVRNGERSVGARSNTRPSNSRTSNSRPSNSRPSNTRRRTVQRWAAGLATGLGLAVLVAILGVIGDDYQNAATSTPDATAVVHVRSGESLSAVAARIAPDLPAASVIATVRDLNDLQTTGLRPGQALIVPAYR